ncbi:hypothetical protein ABBQ38_014168 [Trebouxia sp. C0009 RCD-2024]
MMSVLLIWELALVSTAGACLCCRRDWHRVSNGWSQNNPQRPATHHTLDPTQLRKQCRGGPAICSDLAWFLMQTRITCKESSVEPLPWLSDGLCCAVASATFACFTQSSCCVALGLTVKLTTCDLAVFKLEVLVDTGFW